MYIPSDDRYTKMFYRRCGKSGLKLPAISLGLWHNFGHITPFETQQQILRTAFDNGITHFDLQTTTGRRMARRSAISVFTWIATGIPTGMSW
jgi:L-glyceraldehyde 3-phosphate reductase